MKGEVGLDHILLLVGVGMTVPCIFLSCLFGLRGGEQFFKLLLGDWVPFVPAEGEDLVVVDFLPTCSNVPAIL